MSSRLTPAGQRTANAAAALRHPHPPTEPTGWFADIDPEVQDYPWQPVLAHADGDHREVVSIDVWFTSREECEAFIAGRIIGQGMLPIKD